MSCEQEPLAPLRVLIAEDEMLVAMMLEDILADLGCELVATAPNVETALVLVRREQFDFALLDVNLSGKEIFPVADVVAERGIPFAFATGYGRRGIRPPYDQRPVLEKPIPATALAKLLSELFPDHRADLRRLT